MSFMIPVPDQLLAKIPLFVAIAPLKRPKVNYFNRSMRTPLENQKELLLATAQHSPIMIDQPVFTQLFINWAPPVLKNSKRLTVHPTKLYHGDLDNLDKAVNDALVKASIIADDKLIVGTLKTKAYGKEDVAYVSIWSVKQELVTLENPWASFLDHTNLKQ